MTTSIESIDSSTSRVLVGGVESFRFTSAGPNKVAPGVITPAMLTTAATPLGVGQTWQNVFASRAAGVTYTNSTGRAIFLAVSSGSGNTSGIAIFVDGANLCNSVASISGGAFAASGTMIIPAGSTYSVTTNIAGLASWYELR